MISAGAGGGGGRVDAGILLLLAAAAGSAQGAWADQRALAWMWSQQASDGGWHSKTYGLLRSGQSLTPFVLLALLENDPSAPMTRIDRALKFVRKHTAADGSIGRADAYSQDYPNYATALAIRCEIKAKRPGWEPQVARMVGYLRTQQFSEANGWKQEDPAFGAWGMGGDPIRPPGTGHVDLSMTRHVLQALRESGLVPQSDPLFTNAQVYLSRLQNPDGGFFFSTTEEDTNKAGGHNSYGTATADGILALLATGVSREDARIQKAWQWLVGGHLRPDRIPGFTGEAYERWHQGLAYYYAASLGELHRNHGFARLKVHLPGARRADGSYTNPENLVKEDDPLIATPFQVRYSTVSAGEAAKSS
jgi:hypothetical protein